MKKVFAVWAVRVLIFLGRLGGKKGSTTPGMIALKIYPSLLKELSAQVKEGIVVVCGTNGKTTTNNLIYSMLVSQGKRVVCNNVGANMLDGVATAFASCADWRGRLDADFACIEVDEISTVKVFEHLTPDYMIITNLFRDQLDRYGEIDITTDYLLKAAGKAPNATLVLNSDDPLVAALGKRTKNRCVFFGVGEDTGTPLGETREGRFCGFCGEELIYKYYHYSQLGNYTCPQCGFSRPETEFEAKNISLDGAISFDTDGRHICVDYIGLYNIYNILAAYVTVRLLDAVPDDLQRVLGEYKPQTGRMETFYIGKQVIFNLSKNPAGFNQAISAVYDDKRTKDIIIAINDNAQDGRDISWIWDVDFERLGDVNARCIAASGIRHNDVSVRLKYAGVENRIDNGDIKKAIEEALKSNAEVLYVLVNYTALFSTHDILKGLEGKK